MRRRSSSLCVSGHAVLLWLGLLLLVQMPLTRCSSPSHHHHHHQQQQQTLTPSSISASLVAQRRKRDLIDGTFSKAQVSSRHPLLMGASEDEDDSSNSDLTTSHDGEQQQHDGGTALVSNIMLQHLQRGRGGGGGRSRSSGIGTMWSTNKDAWLGAAFFIGVDAWLKGFFRNNSIDFPHMLGGCIGLFVIMIAAQCIPVGGGGGGGTGNNTNLGEVIFAALSPGAGLLAKWMPVFFLPGLAMLPLAPSVGGPLEIVKLLSVVIVGFLFTLSSVGFSVLSLRTRTAGIKNTPPPPSSSSPSVVVNKKNNKTSTTTTTGSASKAFRDSTVLGLAIGTLVTGIVTILSSSVKDGSNSIIPAAAQGPIRSLFFLLGTVTTFCFGANLPKSITAIVHPLVIGTVCTWTMVAGLGWIVFGGGTSSFFGTMLSHYKVGSVLPWSQAGAGDVLLHMLGPAVMSLSITMYSRKTLLKENILIVGVAIAVSVVGGLFGTALFVRLIALGGSLVLSSSSSKLIRLSVLSRNVTTALAMAITQMLGGDISITASVVVLTGIVGATFARTIMTTFLKIYDPVSRGLAMGSAAQGLGCAAIAMEDDAFPFAALAMVLTAVFATILVSIPAIQKVLTAIAVPSPDAFVVNSVA